MTAPRVGGFLPETVAPDYFAALLRWHAGERETIPPVSQFYEYGYIGPDQWGCTRLLTEDTAARVRERVRELVSAVLAREVA